ncbi:SRPBCC family protein [Andreprevotia chitinilytica]|uniref:SRPBCC family protein n=1 Tax=Andreprevotia chitinilytica TaxID=396808 RepID=UPI00054E2E6D|nr:SRPBCC family protein [Andreprevotia chitinilytica]
MDTPSYVYVCYIATTPEQLWRALTDSELTQKYWRRVESDWLPGSQVTYWIDDARIDLQGIVLLAEPGQMLSFTFGVQWLEHMRDEKPSRVTFELEALGDVVKLTMTHDEFAPGSKVYHGIQQGWPAILSSLKTLLETGKPLHYTHWVDPLEKIGS